MNESQIVLGSGGQGWAGVILLLIVVGVYGFVIWVGVARNIWRRSRAALAPPPASPGAPVPARLDNGSSTVRGR